MESTGPDWEQYYRSGETPWDLRGVTPPLQALAEAGGLAARGLTPGSAVAVPGCGRGHDLRYLAQLGYRVTGFDLVPAAVEEARRLLALNRAEGEVLCRDFLGLGEELAGRFDWAYEYTFFCALPPHLRGEFARVTAALLRPGGYLLALTFPLTAAAAAPSGPPYLVREEDLQATLARHFTLAASFEAERSAPRRTGAERWYLWQRR